MSDENRVTSGNDRTIRVVALGVVRREEADGGEQLLVERHRDPESGETFYRPLGGGVEFGEPSEDALGREFREELGVELTNVSYLDTYEDVFAHGGERHHELWRLYEATIVEDWPYEAESFTACELDGEEMACVWKPLSEFAEGDDIFYPEALLADLTQAQ